ncbi:caspase domain-containing protein [Mycena latifolia]|nr:caspase domain-containing protein [Mycena latifolia]
MSQRLFAFIVGINQYRSDAVSNLQGCVKDAESVRDVLLQRSKDAQVCLLSDTSATQADIIKMFNEHLIDNPRIIRNDPIVVYFACKGLRLMAPPGALGRDLDVLLPYDFCAGVSGISDITIHALLCQLAQKKGENITFILDSSFSRWVPRGGKFAHRSELSSEALSHISQPFGDPAQYGGFFSESATPYVLLAACRQHELAWETSDGGSFTQSFATVMREENAVTYRELLVKLNLRDQNPISIGHQPDRFLFSIPTHSRISTLRIFFDGPQLELDAKPEDDFVRVEKKEEASVAVRSAPDGTIIVERLDGLAAMFGGREVHTSSDSIPFVLNTIAQFNHYLSICPPCPPSSFLHTFKRHTMKPRVELYHFKYDDALRVIRGEKSKNQLRNGVARFFSLPVDRRFGLKVINSSSRELYPYVFCFDPATYVVQALYTYSPGDRPFHPGSSFTVGFGKNGGAPIQLLVEPMKRDAAFFKVIMCERPVDMRRVLQPHSLKESAPSRFAPNGGNAAAMEIPGVWETEIAILSIQLGSRWISCWKSFAESVLRRFSLV